MPELNAIGYNPPNLTNPVFPLTDDAMTTDHEALFRFYDLTNGNRVVGDTLDNELAGYAAATVTAVGGAGYIPIGAASKGVAFASGSQTITLPTSFDVLQAPQDRDVVIAIGLTLGSDPAGTLALAGKMRNTATCQWGILLNGGILQTRFGNGGQNLVAAPAAASSYLITYHFKATGGAQRNVDAWADDAKVVTYNYTPDDSGGYPPVLGTTGSVVSLAGMVIHEAQIFTPPSGYDPAAWIAAERAKLTADLAG